MVTRGAKAILITPTDSKAIVPAIKKARDQGVMVIALDTPTEPQDAADALFATDNFKAGELIGQYAKAKFAATGKTPSIATLDLAPGVSVGVLRHNGFLKGFGHHRRRRQGPRGRRRRPGQGPDGDGELLQKNPDINLVYTINEPAAAGAYQALKAAGKEKGVMIVSVDGGCAGIKNVKTGVIAATSQQYPPKMAEMGVDAGVARAKGKVTGYTDTGVTLITDKPQTGRRLQGHQVRHGQLLGQDRGIH